MLRGLDSLRSLPLEIPHPVFRDNKERTGATSPSRLPPEAYRSQYSRDMGARQLVDDLRQSHPAMLSRSLRASSSQAFQPGSSQPGPQQQVGLAGCLSAQSPQHMVASVQQLHAWKVWRVQPSRAEPALTCKDAHSPKCHPGCLAAPVGQAT